MTLVSHGTVNSGLQEKKRGAHGTKQPLRLKCVYFAPLKMDVRYVCVGFLMALFSSHSHSRSRKCSAFVTYCNNSLSTDCFWLWKWTTSWCIKTKRNTHTYSDTHTHSHESNKKKTNSIQINRIRKTRVNVFLQWISARAWQTVWRQIIHIESKISVCDLSACVHIVCFYVLTLVFVNVYECSNSPNVFISLSSFDFFTTSYTSSSQWIVQSHCY